MSSLHTSRRLASTARHPRRAVLATVGAMLLLVAACGPSDPTVGDADGTAEAGDAGPVETMPEMASITVTRTPLLSDSTVPIASDAGWFEEAGIELTVVEGRSIPELLPLLLAGEVDVMYGSLAPAIAAEMAAGSGIRLVAAGQIMDPSAACPTFALLMPPGATPQLDPANPEALRELRIGAPLGVGIISRWFFEGLSARAGMTLDDLMLENVLTADAAATFAAGSIDALLVTEPGLTRIQEELGLEVVVRVDDVLPNKPLSGLFFGPRLLEDPELAARYLAVHMRAVAEHSKGATERNVAVMSAATGLPPELLREVCWDTMDADSTPYVGAVAEAFDAAVRFDLLEVVPTEEQIWDHSVGVRARELLVEWGVQLDG
jgi:ABC-type nitrate/sulfonate/bicarbonate transport system substrate-binding protein